MIKLTELLETATPLDTLIIKSVVEFMKDYYSMNPNIIIKRKDNDKYLGDISLNNTSINKNKFIVHYNPNGPNEKRIRALLHELTHVKQVYKKELQPAPDWKSIYWKGKEYITVKAYNKISAAEYIKLPWEVEADNNMKVLYPKFLKYLKSKNYDKVKELT